MAGNPLPGSGGEAGVFTDYVRALARGEPEPEAFERVWRALKRDLRGELRRRGLWHSPPRFAGLAGAERWDDEALDELAADAYSFNFVHRLRSLRAQLEVKPTIDGLIRLNLRHFLHERQKRHDPLGYRVFDVARAAAREVVDGERCRVVAGDPRIGNDTWIAGREVSPPEPPTPAEAAAADGPLAEAALHWSRELLPELVTATGKRRRAVEKALAERLAALPGPYLPRFPFKGLVDALKTEVRARWRLADADEPADPALTGLIGLPRPDRAAEERDAFFALVRCVERLLADATLPARTERYLHRLWQYLRLHAAGLDDLPSRRRQAEMLEIPRDRLPELYRFLGELLENCRGRLTGPPTEEGGSP